MSRDPAIRYISFPRLWAALLLGKITLEELRREDAYFYFEYVKEHLLPENMDDVPIEISWFDKGVQLDIKVPGLQFRGLGYGYISRRSNHFLEAHLELWDELREIIEAADANGRVEWFQGVCTTIKMMALDLGQQIDLCGFKLPWYDFLFCNRRDNEGNRIVIGTCVIWKDRDGTTNRLNLSSVHKTHIAWPTQQIGPKTEGESNHLGITTFTEFPAWRTI